MLPQGYCKIFMALAHVDCGVHKWQATNGIKGINVKPYQKVSNNRFQIFLALTSHDYFIQQISSQKES